MHEDRMSGPAKFGAAAVVLLIAVLGLAMYPGWSRIFDAMSDSQAPAWVQAIGSILAIIVAALIASDQGKRARTARMLDRADRYIEQFSPALALTDEAVRVFRLLYLDLFVKSPLPGYAPNVSLWAASDLIVGQFLEIRPTSLPTYASITSVRHIGIMIVGAKDLLHEMGGAAQRLEPHTPERRLAFLRNLRAIRRERDALCRALVVLTQPDDV